MNKIIYITVSFLAMLLSPLLAVTAYPGAVLYEQTDGSNLSIRLHGDEFVNYVTTEDGYLLTDVGGTFEYASIESDGSLSTLRVKAHNSGKRTALELELFKNIFPNSISTADMTRFRAAKMISHQDVSEEQAPKSLRGKQRALVILVEFPNKSFVTQNPLTQFTDLLNKNGYRDNGATGSAADYFEASTFGIFQPQFDVVGPYMLPQNYDYYGANISDSDGRSREMIKDACLAANDDVDFRVYDTDGNGTVENVFVYYAGYNEAEGGGANTIWPHRWSLAPKLTVDGVQIYSYACTSELRGNSGSNMCGIGTFVHEFSHVLGLTDLYATNNSLHRTLGAWDVMDRGVYNNLGRTPPSYSAYERFYLGYLTPQQLRRTQLTILEPLLTSNQAYLVAKSWHNMKPKEPNPAQFYLLENRQRMGWDSVGLPGHGLLITRINYNSTLWNSNSVNSNPSNMGVDIIEADELDGDLSGNPFPGTEKVDEFDNFKNTDYELRNIIEHDSLIIFDFLEEDDDEDDVPSLAVTPCRLTFSTEQFIPSTEQSFVVVSTCGHDDVELTFEVGDYFQLKTRDTDWSSEDLILKPKKGKWEIIERVSIRYAPTMVSDEYGHWDELNISNPDDDFEINLLGYASPAELNSPLALPASDVTSTSFISHWQSVRGASAYYLSLESDLLLLDDDFEPQTICVLDTFYMVTGLTALRGYRYRVSATNSPNLDYPDFVTDLSNVISVQTLKDVTSSIEGVLCDAKGILVTGSETVYIYNALGQLWQVVSPNTSTQYVSLPRGQIFVIKSGANYFKIIR